jgi:hypothetical protein
VTEIEKVPNRGHLLTIDSAWREVADRALTSSSASCSDLRLFDLAERSAGSTVASAKEGVITS